MARQVLAAIVVAAAAIALALAVRSPSPPPIDPADALPPSANTASTPPPAHVPAGAAPLGPNGALPPSQGGEFSAGGPGSETTNASGPGDAGELTVATPKAKGTREALDAQLAKAISAPTPAERRAAIWEAWVEYLSWTQREDGAPVRASALDRLIAVHRGETDADVRRQLLDHISKTAAGAVVDVLLESARHGRTEAERVGAIQDLGRFGEPGALTAMMRLHPDAPDEATAATALQSIRVRARAQLLDLQRGAPSEAERAMLERALRSLPPGEKR